MPPIELTPFELALYGTWAFLCLCVFVRHVYRVVQDIRQLTLHNAEKCAHGIITEPGFRKNLALNHPSREYFGALLQ